MDENSEMFESLLRRLKRKVWNDWFIRSLTSDRMWICVKPIRQLGCRRCPGVTHNCIPPLSVRSCLSIREQELVPTAHRGAEFNPSDINYRRKRKEREEEELWAKETKLISSQIKCVCCFWKRTMFKNELNGCVHSLAGVLTCLLNTGGPRNLDLPSEIGSKDPY